MKQQDTHMDTKYLTINEIAAHLFRLAQAAAFIRCVRENVEPARDADGAIKPTLADVEAVERENPALLVPRKRIRMRPRADDMNANMDIHALLDNCERDGVLSDTVVEAYRAVVLADEEGDDDAQYAAQTALFRRIAEWYQSIGQEDVAQGLHQLANDSAGDVQ
jgi:hypothetical protein